MEEAEGSGIGAECSETLLQEYVRPPLEDRSKYEKLQNIHDEESDEEKPVKEKSKKHHIGHPSRKRSAKGPQGNHSSSSLPNHQPRNSMSLGTGKDPTDYASSQFKESTYHYPQESKKFLPTGDASDAIFECNVSDDDSIGSASDLKARIDEECDYYYCDRGEASENISSSVYHAECESVTTHEEDGTKHDSGLKAGVVGESVPSAGSLAPQRGPKPSRSVLRARAKALKEQESRKSSQDRLLGHEFGEKPLLLDDELDSGEDERGDDKLGLKQHPPGAQSDSSSSFLSQKQSSSISQPYRKMSTEELSPKTDTQDDVFSLAPFKKKNLKNPQKNTFLSRSQPCSNSVSPLNIAGIVTPPAGFNSPASLPIASPDRVDPLMKSADVPKEIPTRKTVQTDIIYEESPSEDFPIYENVTLNEGKPISSGIVTPGGIAPSKGLTTLLNKNPFLNPFLNEDTEGTPTYKEDIETPLVDAPPVESPQQTYPSLSMSGSITELPNSSSVISSEVLQHPNVFETNNLSAITSTPPMDIFGSTPFYGVQGPKEPLPDLLTSSEPFAKGHFKSIDIFSSPHSEGKFFPGPTSTPNRLFKTPQPAPPGDKPPLPSRFTSRSVEHADQDLFGSVPFKPVVSHRQRNLAATKSQTLPANISSSFQSQMAQMAKEEAHQMIAKESFRVPNQEKKCTPPGFRKPRLTHQVLSESESSSEDDSVVSSSRKSKLRDRSKDRLKYRNIGDEYEEENVMVLPTKKEKDKSFKKSKKLDKHEKEKHEKSDKTDKKLDKQEKKPDKMEKKLEKQDKKQDKLEKLREKAEKRQESIGISNMSFEDFTLENSRRNRSDARSESIVLQSPDEEEVSDLRTTGGTRFGSLKRGINPFSKLGR